MRGKHASKPLESVVAEAKALAADGVRELIIVAQDTTYYGKDIEDPEEEVADIDVAFLRLELLEKCGEKDDYNALLEKLKKVDPDDERLE